MHATTNPDGDSRLLPTDAFDFELDRELRRAVRVRSAVTVVVLRASPDTDSDAVESPSPTVMQDLARVMTEAVRDTDLVGCADARSISFALLDAEASHGAHVIDRLLSRLSTRGFQAPVRIAVGAACYPEDAVDAASLRREAAARTVASWRGR